MGPPIPETQAPAPEFENGAQKASLSANEEAEARLIRSLSAHSPLNTTEKLKPASVCLNPFNYQLYHHAPQNLRKGCQEGR